MNGLAGVVVFLLGLPTGCNRTPLRPSDFSGKTPVVRVLLLGSRTRVTVTADVPPSARLLGGGDRKRIDLAPGMPVPLTLTPQGWQFGQASLASRSELTLIPAVEGSVRIDGRAYRGHLRFVPRPATAAGVPSNQFDVVNDVDVENYLRGVVARELPPDFAPAAYAAQCVVARTYALYTVKTVSSTARYDLFADERSQVYGGVTDESPKSIAAVEQTRGEVVAYGPPGRERIFKAYYSACCGGIGQSNVDAFGEPPFPPLAAQQVGHLCDASPSFNWRPIVVTKTELTRRLRKWAATRNRPERDLATVRKIDVSARNAFGRPVKFAVTDSTGRRFPLSGEELRTAVNTDAPPKAKLLSSLFDLDVQRDAIGFVNGHGRGHGVGLCQYCAQARAVAGTGYRDIVTLAYPSAVILRAY